MYEAFHSTSIAKFLYDALCGFANRLNGLGLLEKEIALFTSVIIMDPTRNGLRNIGLVQKIHKKLDDLLQREISVNHVDRSGLFVELKKMIPDLRTLSTLYSEKLFAYKMEPSCNPSECSSSCGSPSSDSKDGLDTNFGSFRSVSSSVASTESVKSPPRSSSVSSAKSSHGYIAYSPEMVIATCPKRYRENGNSSSDESYYTELPSKNGAIVGANYAKLRKVDSPSDSGIESGKEHCSGSTPCSSPRSAFSVDEKMKDDDVPTYPLLKRALERPPLSHCTPQPYWTTDPTIRDGPDSASGDFSSKPLSVRSSLSPFSNDDKMTTINEKPTPYPLMKMALSKPALIEPPQIIMEQAFRHHYKKFRAVSSYPQVTSINGHDGVLDLSNKHH